MITLLSTLTDQVAASKAIGVTLHAVTAADYGVLGALHDQVFGPGALTRTAYRVREGVVEHTAYCRLARDQHGAVMAFIRFAPIRIGGGGRALMLGPLAVDGAYANQGHARRLIASGLKAAEAGGMRLIVLVGDAAYYGKLGFVAVPVGQITMPGPVDPARLLAFELEAGALASYRGMISGDRQT